MAIRFFLFIFCIIHFNISLVYGQYDQLKGQEAERLRHKSNDPIKGKPTSAEYDYKAFYWGKKRNGTTKNQYLLASYLRSAVLKDPTNALYQIELGNFYIDAFSEYKLAEKCFRDAINLGVSDLALIYKTSMCCFKNGNLLDATDFYLDAQSNGWTDDYFGLHGKLGLNNIIESSQKSFGKYVWTTENLNVDTYRNGDTIPQVTDPSAWSQLKTGAWCYLDNDPNNSKKYGKLYNWYAVNDPRGLAPSGYHIPSLLEWNDFIHFHNGKDKDQILNLEGNYRVSIECCNKLKADKGWYLKGDSLDRSKSYLNANGNNQSGFAALPGCERNSDGSFRLLRNYDAAGFWWSSSTDQEVESSASHLFIGAIDGYIYPTEKNSGISVRLIKNYDGWRHRDRDKKNP